MAHGQPNPLAQFVKGKSPYTVANFCATLNWLISCLKGLKGDAGVNITGLLDGTPHIGLKLVEGDGIKIASTPGGSKKITCTLDPAIDVTAVDVESGSEDTATGMHALKFESASDSHVTLNLTGDEEGNATLTIGVHYAD